jgi:hypothetical protein
MTYAQQVRAGPCLLPSGDAILDVRFRLGALAHPREMGTSSRMPGASCENRTTMGKDNRSVLDHAYCLPSGNSIVDVGVPSVDFEEMGTTASSMLGAGLCETQDHGRRQQIRAGPCLLLAVGQCHRGVGEPSVDFEEMGTTASSMPGAGCMGRRTMGGDNRLVLDHVCCLPSGDASVDVGEPSVSFEEMGSTASSIRRPAL